MKSALFLVTTLCAAAPLAAQTAPAVDPLAPLPTAPPVATPAPPPAPKVAAPKDWRGVFEAIDAGNWASAQLGIAMLPPSPLTAVAKAELFTAKSSPVTELGALTALLTQAPELPHASQLARMAQARGSTAEIAYYQPQRTISLGSAPGRFRARPVSGEPAADTLRATLNALVEVRDAPGAEAQLLTAVPLLSAEARAEAAHRVAFAYYVLGLDMDARRVADTWRQGAAGEWASQNAWVSGLASWRMGDCESASRAFQVVAGSTQQRELRAGSLYWAARSEQMCRRPRSVAPLLKAAAESAESFYGLLARQTLGMDTKLPADPFVGSDPSVAHLPNVQRATELARIGWASLAEEMLRHQAKIGSPSEHHALIQVAKKLDLPGAQMWLANFGQPGARADASDRYPNPRWAPLNGWRVDPALAFGHIVQESLFKRNAVSPVGAVGLMQVRPGTAQDIARAANMPYSRSVLTDPRYNLEYGQGFIEMMRRSSATAGQLPRVIAAYNAGPLPVGRWAAINDKGDPLLWMESLPYWETRFYVPSVLRNMWVYQGLNQQDAASLKAMAEHRWPTFPTSMAGLKH